MWREGGGASGPGPAREDQTSCLPAPTASIKDKVIFCQICLELLDINALTKKFFTQRRANFGLKVSEFPLKLVCVQNCGCLSLPGSPSSGRYHAAATDRADRESANLQSTLLEKKSTQSEKRKNVFIVPF